MENLNDSRSFTDAKEPPYSYITIIIMAFENSGNEMLSTFEIYKIIMDMYPFYRRDEERHKNCIRKTLSRNVDYFVKNARTPDKPGRGSIWSLQPKSGNVSENGNRRKCQREQKAHINDPVPDVKNPENGNSRLEREWKPNNFNMVQSHLDKDVALFITQMAHKYQWTFCDERWIPIPIDQDHFLGPLLDNFNEGEMNKNS